MSRQKQKSLSMNSSFFREGILKIPLILDINAIQENILSDNHNEIIDILLLRQFKIKYEGKCTNEGWIQPGGSKLIKRSLGKIEAEYFNNFIKIQCEFKVNYCHPLKEQKLEVTIDSINNLGIKCIQGPLYIILPKQHHIEKDKFNSLQEGDTILITIQYTRIRLFEPHIDIIATLDKKIKSASYSRQSKASSRDSSKEEILEGGDNEMGDLSSESDDENIGVF